MNGKSTITSLATTFGLFLSLFFLGACAKVSKRGAFLARNNSATDSPKEIVVASETEDRLQFRNGDLRITEDEAVKLALQYNPDIMMARQQVIVSKSDALARSGYYLPQVVLQADYGQNPDRSNFRSVADSEQKGDNYRRMDAYLKQSLVNGGVARADHRQARHRQKASEYQVRAVENAVISMVKSAFARVNGLQETYQIQKQHLKRVNGLVSTVGNRLKGGEASESTLARARMGAEESKHDLLQIASDLRKEKLLLVEWMGIEDANVNKLELVGGGSSMDGLPDYESVMGEALDQRPELQALKSVIRAEEAGVKAAKGEYLPKVDLVAGYSAENREDVSSDKWLDDWSVGVHGRWVLFDRNRIRGNVARQKAVQRQAMLEYQKAKLAIRNEVDQAFFKLRKAKSLMASGRALQGHAKRSYEFSLASFREGEVLGVQDVIKTSGEWTAAQLMLSKARKDYQMSMIQLEKAQGGVVGPGLQL